MVVMVMTVFVMMVVIILVVIFFIMVMVFMLIMVMMFMFIMVMIFMFLVMMMFVMFILLVIMIGFDFMNPGSGSCHFFKIEHIGIQNLIQIHISVIALNDLGLGLQGSHDFLQAIQFGA